MECLHYLPPALVDGSQRKQRWQSMPNLIARCKYSFLDISHLLQLMLQIVCRCLAEEFELGLPDLTLIQGLEKATKLLLEAKQFNSQVFPSALGFLHTDMMAEVFSMGEAFRDSAST